MKIDTRGKLCPIPIILTKKAINSANEGQKIEIILDNDIACNNLADFLKELKLEFTLNKQETLTTITLYKGNKQLEENEEIFCEVAPIKKELSDFAIVLKSETMGEGDEDLGRILIRAYLSTVCESNLPEYIIIYNAGVKLALDGSDTAKYLKNLESKGVTIISCGACVSYYDLESQISIGQIGNMYKITEILSKISKVIYP